MLSFKNIAFAKRLVIIFIVSIPLLSLSSVHFVDQYKKSLYEQKKESIANEVRMVCSTIASYDSMAKEGLITDEEAKSLALSLIKSERYSGDHYFWVQDEQSNMILHAINHEISDKNMASTRDVGGYPLFSEMSQIGRGKGQGFVQYRAAKPDGEEYLLKIAYVQNYRPWGWIIGTGIYVDDINAQLVATIGEIIVAALLVILVITLLVFVILRGVGRGRHEVDYAP